MITPVLRVHDIDLSLTFYRQILGFSGEGGLPGSDGKTAYAEAHLGDAHIMFSRRCDAAPLTCGVELYLTLPELSGHWSFLRHAQGARSLFPCRHASGIVGRLRLHDYRPRRQPPDLRPGTALSRRHRGAARDGNRLTLLLQPE